MRVTSEVVMICKRYNVLELEPRCVGLFERFLILPASTNSLIACSEALWVFQKKRRL